MNWPAFGPPGLNRFIILIDLPRRSQACPGPLFAYCKIAMILLEAVRADREVELRLVLDSGLIRNRIRSV